MRNSKFKRPIKQDLEVRTKTFAVDIIRFVSTLPSNTATRVIGQQLLKSGTSIGANYREANRAESKKDFIHKIALVEKEAAETQYWLELVKESNLYTNEEITVLHQECSELVALFTAIGRTSKERS